MNSKFVIPHSSIVRNLLFFFAFFRAIHKTQSHFQYWKGLSNFKQNQCDYFFLSAGFSVFIFGSSILASRKPALAASASLAYWPCLVLP